MKRGGFEDRQVQFVSGHKSVQSLSKYNALTVLDKTKAALALQQGPATLDGDIVDFDSLARGGQKRKNDEPVASTSKKVTSNPNPLWNQDIIEACGTDPIIGDMENSGLGTSEITEDPFEPPADVKHPKTEVSEDIPEPAITSSQGHNVAQLIRDQMTLSRDQMNSSKELINNYLSALKKK